MKKAQKAIITCAVTGSVHTPGMSEYLPITPFQIAEQAANAAKAGAADRQLGDEWYLSVLGAGRHQMPFAAMSAAMGGNVRVGLEDSLMLSRGRLASTNAEQVAKIRRILEELGRDIASPADARDMLCLKGGDEVAF